MVALVLGNRVFEYLFTNCGERQFVNDSWKRRKKRKRSPGETKEDKLLSNRDTDVLFTGEVIYRCFSKQILPRSLFNHLGIDNLELWTSKCVLLKLEERFGSPIVEYVKTGFKIFPCPSTQRSSRCFRCIIHQECSFHVAAVSADNIWRPFKKNPDFGEKVPVYLWSGKGKMELVEN
ncbi:hypothetical protein K1719_021836 [Acacia pycnantha]|nr:hypothetical protein K1719_021836 [Acacia pycnantha]